MDFASREPFGFPIDDVRAAMQMATTVNAAGANPPVAQTSFLIGPQLLDPADEDGEQSADALALKIAAMMPPKPKQVEGE